MEFENLLKLVRAVSDSSLSSFKYEEDGVKISLQADRAPKVNIAASAEQVVQTVSTAVSIDEVPAAVNQEGQAVNSPLVGTFYAAPAEDAEPFVAIGDVVKKGQTLAIVEAMKLMNEIESEADGTIAEVLVKNGEAVEYGQPLFRIV